MATLRLTLRPSPHRSPNRTVGFEAYLGSTLLCVSSQPLFEAARALLALAYPGSTLLTFRHDGAAFDSVVPARLDALAKLRAIDSDAQLRLAKFVEFDCALRERVG